MIKKLLKGIFSIVLIVLFIGAGMSNISISESGGSTIYVDDDNTAGPWDGSIEHPYQHIQDAIDNATSGDTIFVYNGTYYENLNIGKTISLIGEHKENTIINGCHPRDVVSITANEVNLERFTIKNSSYWNVAIRIDNASCCNIRNNDIENSSLGIWISYSNNCDISHNSLTGCGVLIEGNKLKHYSHTIERNVVNGKPLMYYKNIDTLIIREREIGEIVLMNCSDFEISNITIDNADIAIEIVYCHNGIIYNCNISGNKYGIGFVCSNNCNVRNNNIDNNYAGIVFEELDENNYIIGNNITRNFYAALHIQSNSRNNYISQNKIVTNVLSSIVIADNTCTNNMIWNNEFIGGIPWDVSLNKWDNGTIGNYWSNQWYAIDLNSDGISDIPYLIRPLFINKDRYPLMGHGPHADIYLDIKVPSQGYLYIDDHEQRKLPENKTIVFALPWMNPLEIQVHAGGPYGIEGISGYIDYDKNHPEEVDFILTHQYGDLYTGILNKSTIGMHTLSIVAYDRFHNHKMISIPIFFFYIPKL